MLRFRDKKRKTEAQKYKFWVIYEGPKLGFRAQLWNSGIKCIWSLVIALANFFFLLCTKCKSVLPTRMILSLIWILFFNNSINKIAFCELHGFTEHSFYYVNSLPQKMLLFYALNATLKDFTIMAMHSCYLRVVSGKSDIFLMIFGTYLLLMKFGIREQV